MKARLQKIIADAGICSRREAERLIAEGEVSVNGEIVKRPGLKIRLSRLSLDVGSDIIFVSVFELPIKLGFRSQSLLKSDPGSFMQPRGARPGWNRKKNRAISDPAICPLARSRSGTCRESASRLILAGVEILLAPHVKIRLSHEASGA